MNTDRATYERRQAARMRSLERLDQLRESPGLATEMTNEEMVEHRALDHQLSSQLRKRAALPSVEVEIQLLDLLDLADDLSRGLEELGQDADWVAWLSAGAINGRSHQRGPWVWHADELADRMRTIHERLNLIEDSFEFRCLRNLERAKGNGAT